MPEELDKACRNTIRREYARRERRVRFKQFRRAAARVAVAVFVVIGILSTLVFSVEAWRVKVTDFFTRQTERYTAISMQEEKDTEIKKQPINLFCELVPVGYTETDRVDDADAGFRAVFFVNEDGDRINLDILDADWEINIDTEDAVTYEMMIGDTGVMVIEKHGYSLVWSDGNGNIYKFYASALSKTEVIELCAALIVELEDGAIAAGDS